MAWDYTDKLIGLFSSTLKDPHLSHSGEILDADGLGKYGSIECGDAIYLYFNVERDSDPMKDRIIEVKYRTFGCTSAIAASEALCIMLESEKPTVKEAMSVTNKSIVRFLDGMPSEKIHCSVMCKEVLYEAISFWAKKRDVDYQSLIDLKESGGAGSKIVCECYDLTEDFIKEKIKSLDLENIDQVKDKINAGAACGLCISDHGGLVDLLLEKDNGEETDDEVISSSEKLYIRSEVKKEMDTPMIKEMMGVDLIEVKDNLVYCSFDDKSQKNLLEIHLKDCIDERIRIIET